MRAGVASGRPLHGDVETCLLPELTSFFSISSLRPVSLLANNCCPRCCSAGLSVFFGASQVQPSQSFVIDSSRMMQEVLNGLGGSQITFGAG